MARIEPVVFVDEAVDIVEFIKRVLISVPDLPTPSQVTLKKLFVIELDEIGDNADAQRYLKSQMLRYKTSGKCDFTECVAALVVLSSDECYTKTYAKKFIYLANAMGCEFIGHPLVERVKDRQNFKTWSKVMDMPLSDIEKVQIERLVHRLSQYEAIKKAHLNFLVLHAGHKDISNTLMLWDQIKAPLADHFDDTISIQELHVEEGRITDCYGCSFETCMYYSLEKSCFYGGFVVESLFPSIEKADVIVWICPNYNDSVSAKLMAVINRLTALYRKISFNDKYILSIIVSGNSGNDSVAGQLIGALNINKGFRLPPHFAAMAIANDPGEILNVENLDKRVSDYVNIVYKLTNKIISKS